MDNHGRKILCVQQIAGRIAMNDLQWRDLNLHLHLWLGGLGAQIVRITVVPKFSRASCQ